PVLAENESAAPFLIDPFGKRFIMGRAKEMILEDNGSERAVVKLSGDYVAEEDNTREAAFSYVIRIFAYRGRAELKVGHSLICQAKEAALQELAFHVPLENPVYAAGNDAGESFTLPAAAPGVVTGILQDSEDEYRIGGLNGNEMKVQQGRHQWWLAAGT